MAKKQAPVAGRVRTREHVIADLAVNHVERQVFLCGYTAQKQYHDYGIDLTVCTFNGRGEQESGNIFIQVKATEQAKVLRSAQAVAVRVDRANLRTWLSEVLPVVLVVYDVAANTACWVHVQDYFQRQAGFNLFRANQTVTIRVPASQVLDEEAVRGFAIIRDQTYAQLRTR